MSVRFNILTSTDMIDTSITSTVFSDIETTGVYLVTSVKGLEVFPFSALFIECSKYIMLFIM